MYRFPEKEMFLRYDQKGKSYILATHTLPWAHKDNPKYYTLKADQHVLMEKLLIYLTPLGLLLK